MADDRKERRNLKAFARRAELEANTRSRLESDRSASGDAFQKVNIEANPFRFRGVYSPSIYMPAENPNPWAQRTPQAIAEQMVRHLKTPGIDFNVFSYVADPGFGTPGQASIESFLGFNPRRNFMTLDIEWLGSPGTDLLDVTEVAMARVHGDRIEVLNQLVAPGKEAADKLQAIINKAKTGQRLTADEARSLRDLMLYSEQSNMGLPGAQFDADGRLIRQAEWARKLGQTDDLRPFLGAAEEALRIRQQRGRSIQEVSNWIAQAVASAHAHGETIVTWNGLNAEFPVIRAAMGPDSDAFQTLSRAKHLDLMAAARTMVENPLAEIIEPLKGRPLTDEEIREIGGYLRQEELANLRNLNKQAHQAASDVEALAILSRDIHPILQKAYERARVVGAGALEMPGRQVFDPTPIRQGQWLYATRGMKLDRAVLYRNGKEVADQFAYRGIRKDVSYRVSAIRPFEAGGQRLIGVHLNPLGQFNESLFVAFESQNELFNFFQGFTPASVDPETGMPTAPFHQAARFSIEESARRRLTGFTEFRPGQSYGFRSAYRFHFTAAQMAAEGLTPEDVRRMPLSQIQERLGRGATEAQARDFRLLFGRLSSESGIVAGRFTGVLAALEHIQRNVSLERFGHNRHLVRTQTLAAFMRRFNEAMGFGPEGPMEDAELPLSRRNALRIRIGEDERDIPLLRRTNAVSTLHRIISEVARPASGLRKPGEQEKFWALHNRLLPAIEQEIALTEEERGRIVRHGRLHQQVEELAGILVERNLELDTASRLVPSLSRRTGKLPTAEEIITMANEAIAEAGRRTIARPGTAKALASPEALQLFNQMNEMVRAPFAPNISARFARPQEVVMGLQDRLAKHRLASELFVDEATGRMVLGIAQAEFADDVFSSIYRNGWQGRDRARAIWIDLPKIERGGILTGGRLSRPVLDLTKEGAPIIRSRFEFALDIDDFRIRSMRSALLAGATAEAERIVNREIRERLERAPWTRAPWDDPFDFAFTASRNIASFNRLQVAETTFPVVQLVAQKLGIDLQRPEDTQTLSARDRTKLMEAVQNEVPKMFGVESQLSSVKGEYVSKFMIGLAAGDVRELMPFGHRVDVGRDAPRQIFATTPILEENVRRLMHGPRGIIPGSVVTTEARHAIESAFGIPLSTATIKAAIVGREDLRQALEVLAPHQRRLVERSGLLTTADEQIIIPESLARFFTSEEMHAVRVSADAELSAKIARAIDAKGKLIADHEVIIQANEEIARVKRAERLERIFVEIQNAEIIFKGIRPTESGENELQFAIRRRLTQGSRIRLGTHKGVASVLPDEAFRLLAPGVQALFFPNVQKRRQEAEIAVGQLSKAIPDFMGSASRRAWFKRRLAMRTGIVAEWVRAPQDVGVPWQLALPTKGDIPLKKIEAFIQELGYDVSKRLLPGGPQVVTLMTDFARLEQEERTLQLMRPDRLVPQGRGIALGLREESVLRQHGLGMVAEWARDYAELVGQEPDADPKQLHAALRANRGSLELERTMRASDFERGILPVRGDRGYRLEEIAGTIFDIDKTGTQAFMLDLELPGFERATGGRSARIAVAPERLLQAGDDLFLGEINQKLRRVLETAEEVRRFHGLSPEEIEFQSKQTIDDLYNRLAAQMDDYQEALSKALTDYHSTTFRRARLPGARMRVHVVDSAIDRVGVAEARISLEDFQALGFDSDVPAVALINRDPTDPSSIQPVRVIADARMSPGQVAINEITGHAMGADTDSDTISMFMVRSRLGEAFEHQRRLIEKDETISEIERQNKLQEIDRKIKLAESLDRRWIEEIAPEIDRRVRAQQQGGYPLGVYTEDAYKALLYDDTSGYASRLSASDRVARFTSKLLGESIQAVSSEDDFLNVLRQRISSSVIGTLTNQINQITGLAETLWGADSTDFANLRDFLDLINQKSISAQKHATGFSQDLVDRYGTQMAVAVREALKQARFDDLEAMLNAMGKDAKTKRDFTEDFVKENVDLLRKLHRQAGSSWSHPWLRIGLTGGIEPDQLMRELGPVTPSVRRMFEQMGLASDEIDALHHRWLETVRRQAALGATSEAGQEIMARSSSAQALERSVQRAVAEARLGTVFKGSLFGGGVVAAAWLLPHFLGGPIAEIQGPDRERAEAMAGLQKMMLPGYAGMPNVQPAALPPPMSGLSVLVRAQSSGGITADEFSALIQQAAESSVQMPLNVNMNIRDNRSAIDDSWVQSQIAKALE